MPRAFVATVAFFLALLYPATSRAQCASGVQGDSCPKNDHYCPRDANGNVSGANWACWGTSNSIAHYWRFDEDQRDWIEVGKAQMPTRWYPSPRCSLWTTGSKYCGVYFCVDDPMLGSVSEPPDECGGLAGQNSAPSEPNLQITYGSAIHERCFGSEGNEPPHWKDFPWTFDATKPPKPCQSCKAGTAHGFSPGGDLGTPSSPEPNTSGFGLALEAR